MNTFINTISNLINDGNEWHEWLFSMYNQNRNANLGNTSSASANQPPMSVTQVSTYFMDIQNTIFMFFLAGTFLRHLRKLARRKQNIV